MSQNTAFYYPKESLGLRDDVRGAQMWAVALEQTMLTYFELQPFCRFEAHRHESEQITLVLEGVLFFEVDEDTVEVKAGEVIAIPSNVRHAVYTREQAVKAIDAWSPIMGNYAR